MRFFRWHVWRYPVGLIVGGGLACLAIYKLDVPVNVSLYTAFIIVAIIWSLSSRIPFGIASACLIAIIIVSIMVSDANGMQSNLREQLALGAFYGVVVGVILLVRERFWQPKNKRAHSDVQQAADTADTVLGGGLADITVPKALPASRPVAPRHLQAHKPMQGVHAKPSSGHNAQYKPEGASGARANQQRLATKYKPHLAPHPLIHPQGPKPNPVRTAGSGRTMDVMRPVSHQSKTQGAPAPSRGQRRKLVQL